MEVEDEVLVEDEVPLFFDVVCRCDSRACCAGVGCDELLAHCECSAWASRCLSYATQYRRTSAVAFRVWVVLGALHGLTSFPHHTGITKQECELAGCCYKPKGEKGEIPWYDGIVLHAR